MFGPGSAAPLQDATTAARYRDDAYSAKVCAVAGNELRTSAAHQSANAWPWRW